MDVSTGKSRTAFFKALGAGLLPLLNLPLDERPALPHHPGWHITHREHNRRMHAMHGNTAHEQAQPPQPRRLVRRSEDGTDPEPTESRRSRRLERRRSIWLFQARWLSNFHDNPPTTAATDTQLLAAPPHLDPPGAATAGARAETEAREVGRWATPPRRHDPYRVAGALRRDIARAHDTSQLHLLNWLTAGDSGAEHRLSRQHHLVELTWLRDVHQHGSAQISSRARLRSLLMLALHSQQLRALLHRQRQQLLQLRSANETSLEDGCTVHEPLPSLMAGAEVLTPSQGRTTDLTAWAGTPMQNSSLDTPVNPTQATALEGEPSRAPPPLAQAQPSRCACPEACCRVAVKAEAEAHPDRSPDAPAATALVPREDRAYLCRICAEVADDACHSCGLGSCCWADRLRQRPCCRGDEEEQRASTSLQDLGQDMVDLVVAHFAYERDMSDQALEAHAHFIRRAHLATYSLVSAVGTLCTELHAAAAKELLRRRAEDGCSHLPHNIYVFVETSAPRGECADVPIDILKESLAFSVASDRSAAARSEETAAERLMLAEGREYLSRRAMAMAELRSMFDSDPRRYIPQPDSILRQCPPASIMIVIEASGELTSEIYVRAALDAPLADIFAGDGSGLRLLHDGDRLNTGFTPRQFGWHNESEHPVLQLFTEQTGGGDNAQSTGDAPHAAAGQQAHQPVGGGVHQQWLQLVREVTAHGNPSDGDDEDGTSMDLNVSRGALGAASQLLFLMGRAAANNRSDRAMHAAALMHVYGLTNHQAISYAGASGRTTRRAAETMQRHLEGLGHENTATAAGHRQSTEVAGTAAHPEVAPPNPSKRPVPPCHGCAGCIKPNCGKCKPCTERANAGSSRTIRRRCDERKCIESDTPPAPLPTQPTEFWGGAALQANQSARPLPPSLLHGGCPTLGGCTGCNANDCGLCIPCLDKPKFGGRGTRKRRCERRRCQGPTVAALHDLIGGPPRDPPPPPQPPPPPRPAPHAGPRPPPPPPRPQPQRGGSQQPQQTRPTERPITLAGLRLRDTPRLQYQQHRPAKGQCGYLQHSPLVCDGTGDCLGCWQTWHQEHGPFRPLHYPDLPPGQAARPGQLPRHVARAAMALPCCTAEARDGAGTTLLIGKPVPIHTFEVTLSGGTREIAARRLDCIGMYVGGALRKWKTHVARAAIDPADGAYAVAMLGHVLCSASDPTGISLLCEGGWVNAFLHCVELTLEDGTTVLATYAFAAATIYQETELRVLYDDKRGTYSSIRHAKNYAAAERDPRGPADFSSEEISSLPDQVWRAFEPSALATALRWGGVIDYGSASADTNVLREPSDTPQAAAPLARPQRDQAATATWIDATPEGRERRAARRLAQQHAPMPLRPIDADEKEQALGRRVPNTEEADAVYACAICGDEDVLHATTPREARCKDHNSSAAALPRGAHTAVCKICASECSPTAAGVCGPCDDTITRPTAASTHPTQAGPPEAAADSPHGGLGREAARQRSRQRPAPSTTLCSMCGADWLSDEMGAIVCDECRMITISAGAGVGGSWSIDKGPSPNSGVTAQEARLQRDTDLRYTALRNNITGGAAPTGPALRRPMAAPTPIINDAIGVSQGTHCDEKERQQKRRARFSITPGTVESVNVSTPRRGVVHRLNVPVNIFSANDSAPPSKDAVLAYSNWLYYNLKPKGWQHPGQNHGNLTPGRARPGGQEADELRDNTLDAMADTAQTMMRGGNVEIACGCDPPRQDRQGHTCTCHGAVIAHLLRTSVARQYSLERDTEEAATREARARLPSSKHVTFAEAATAPESGTSTDKLTGRRAGTRSDTTTEIVDGLPITTKKRPQAAAVKLTPRERRAAIAASPNPRSPPPPDPNDSDDDDDLHAALAMSLTEESERIYEMLPSLRGKEGTTVIHLFSGPARDDGLAAALSALGLHVIEFDISRNPLDDLTRPDLRAAILAAIDVNMIAAVLIGTPCKSYSVAHGSDGGTGEAWRTKGHLHGRPDLSDSAKAFLEKADAMLDFSAEVMEACVRTNTPAILENPAPRDDKKYRSYWEAASHMVTIWHMPRMVKLRSAMGAALSLVVMPQCPFGPGPHGKLFQKYTGLLCTPAAAAYMLSLHLECHHTAGTHDSAAGLDEHGASNSEMAAAYPGHMYTAAAIALCKGNADVDTTVAHERLLAALTSVKADTHAKRRLAAPPTALGLMPPGGPAASAAGPAGGGGTDEDTDDEGDRERKRQKQEPAPLPPPPEPRPQPLAAVHAPGAPHDTTSHSPSLPRPLEPVEQGRGSTVKGSPECGDESTKLPLLYFDGLSKDQFNNLARADLRSATPAATPHDSIIIVPVRTSAITGGLPLALMPMHSGVFGIPESKHERSGRREAAVDAAAAVTAEVGVHKSVCFLAGEIDAVGRGFDDDGNARTSVVVAPCDNSTLCAEIAATAHDAAALRAAWAQRSRGAEPHTWMTLDALAAATESPDSMARYRAAATAIAMAEAHVRPTPEAPAYIRSGARTRKHAQAPTSKSVPGSIPLSERVRRADAACEELYSELRGQDPAADPSFAEFCGGLAEQVGNCGTDQIPKELLDTCLPKPPDDLVMRPFQHRAQVQKNLPRPHAPPQEPPPDGWWPNSIEDIVQPEPLAQIRDWLRRCERWHRRGGRDSERPAAEAYGEDSLYPRARGRCWDLRGGKGNITLWRDYTEEERQERTCINLKFAKELFSDCIDEEFVEFLVAGVRFHAGLEHQIVLMPNLLSLYRDGGVGAAAAQADDMVRLGFIAVFDDLPSVPYRVIPRGVVPKAGTDELRGIADQGAPRKPLHTRRKGADHPPPGDAVEALNDKCRADPSWDHEDKDTLSSAAFNGAILQALADITGEVTIELALDMSKWFHRMFYSALDLWTTGAVIPSDASSGLRLAIEMAMTMGATPASQIAQRFANAMVQKVCIEMDKLETAARATEPLSPELQHALDRRNSDLPSDSYSTQGRLYDLTYYSDDGHGMVVGARRAVRFLRAFWTIAGPDGLRAPLSRASKQQIGVCVIWLGGTLAAGLGLVWIPKEKVARAALGLRTTIDGQMPVSDYRRLIGFLVSVLFMLGGDRNLLNHVFRPLKPGYFPPNEIDKGPATLVEVDELMGPTLKRWLKLILNTPGAAAMSAVTPTPPDAAAPRHRIRTDAALQGTPRPGLGGCMYGLWWALAIADQPGLETLDIPHLELLAACIGILTYAEILQGAEHVDIDTDALATAIALQERARSPTLQAILDTLMLSPVYQEIAPRLGVVHLFGASNILSDAASRGYDETLHAVADALGITPKRIDLSTEAQRFLQEALDKITALRPGAGKGSTAIHRGNPNLRGDHPIAHGAAGTSPPRSPTAAPLQAFHSTRPPHGAAPQRRQRTAYADGPSPPRHRQLGARHAPRTPPALPQPPAQRGRHHQSYAQAVSPTAAPLASGPRHQTAATAIGATHLGSDLRSKFDAVDTSAANRTQQPHGHTPAAPAPRPSSPSAAPLQRGPTPRDGEAALQPPPPQHKPRAVSELDRARERVAGQLFDKLRADTSEHALAANDTMLQWMCEVSLGDPNDTPTNTQSNLRSNWRHWEKYCAAVGPDTDPWRPNVEELDALGVERERVLWTAGLIWIYRYSMKPKPGNYIKYGDYAGQLQPCAPKNALAILRGVRKEHLDRNRTPPSLTLATRRMHEMTARYAKWIGPENLVAKKKTTLTHALITGMLAVKEHTILPIRKQSARAHTATTDDIDAVNAGDNARRAGTSWTWRTDFGISCHALFNVLSQTGFRKAEVTLASGGEEWGNMNISFANLTWRFQGRPDTASPTAWELFNIKEGDYAILRPPPSKCDLQAMRWGNSPIWLPYSSSAALNAARALAKWELQARVAPEARRTTPLFCGPAGSGSALTEGICDDVFHGLLGSVLGDKAAAKEYSIHSFRSFLASSMIAANCTDAQVQAALRWASAEALAEYKQINAEVYGGWILSAEKQKLTGLRAAGLARVQPVTDELLLHQTIHSSRAECIQDAALADRDVGSAALVEVVDGRNEPPPILARAHSASVGGLPMAYATPRQ